jgi:hypothetical protein
VRSGFRGTCLIEGAYLGKKTVVLDSFPLADIVVGLLPRLELVEEAVVLPVVTKRQDVLDLAGDQKVQLAHHQRLLKAVDNTWELEN